MRTAKLQLVLDKELVAAVKEILKPRKLSINEVCSLYLRALVSSNKRLIPYALTDKMRFGKYEGELLEVIIRAEPKYVYWLIANSDNFKLQPEAHELLEQIGQTVGIGGM